MAFGTLEQSDNTRQLLNQSVIEYGEQEVYFEIQRQLDAHNTLIRSLVPELCEITTDQQRAYGGTAQLKMEAGDEPGMPDAQKNFVGTNLGFPLRRARLGIQWTRDWLNDHSVAELQALYTQAEDADILYLQDAIRRAIFTPTNNLAYVDRLGNNLNLELRAFLNGDGQPVPVSPDGNVFDGTHNHYNATTKVLSSDSTSVDIVKDVITNVVEHGQVGEVRLYINRQEENAIWNMTNTFFAFPDREIRQPDNVAYALGQTLDNTNPNNRAIGRLDGAIVYVKPWVPAGYLLAVDTGREGYKPLAYRIRPRGINANLEIMAENENFPLRCQKFQRDFGIGVNQRHMAAITQVGAAQENVYVPPTF